MLLHRDYPATFPTERFRLVHSSTAILLEMDSSADPGRVTKSSSKITSNFRKSTVHIYIYIFHYCHIILYYMLIAHYIFFFPQNYPILSEIV